MCMGSSGSAPPPAAIAPPPIATDEAGMQARDNERKRQAKAAGAASTILTGPTGTSSQAQTTQKTLLGA